MLIPLARSNSAMLSTQSTHLLRKGPWSNWGDKTPIELLIAGVWGREVGLRRVLAKMPSREPQP